MPSHSYGVLVWRGCEEEANCHRGQWAGSFLQAWYFHVPRQEGYRQGDGIGLNNLRTIDGQAVSPVQKAGLACGDAAPKGGMTI